MNQTSFQNFLQQGIQYHENGLFNKALEHYQEAFRINPNNAKINYLLGVLAFQGKNYDLAEELLQAAIQKSKRAPAKDSDQTSYYQQLGLVYLAKNEFDNAISNYEQALEDNIDPAIIHTNLGSAYLRMERWNHALEHFKKALEFDPQRIEAHNNIGYIYQKHKDYLRSNQHLEQAIAIKPTFNCLLNLGKNAVFLSLNDKAVDYFLQAEEYLGSSQVYLTDLAIAVRDAGFNEFAARLFSQLGIILHQTGQLQTALGAFRTACTLAPESPIHFSNLGTFFSDINELDAALTTFNQAFKLDPNRYDTVFNYSRFLKKRGQYDEALDALFKIKADEKNGDGIVNAAIADLKVALGDYVSAIEYFDEALALSPNNASYRYDRGLAYLTLGIFDKGWDDYVWRIEEESGEKYIPIPDSGNQVLPRPEPFAEENLQGAHFLFLKEQGLGDQIFFSRFIPQLKEKGARVSLFADEKIEGFFERTDLFDTVFSSTGQGNRNIPADVTHLFAMGDLPRICNHTSVEGTPKPLSLTPVPARLSTAKKRLQKIGDGPYLGITWRAGTEQMKGQKETLFKQMDLSGLAATIESWPGQVVILQRNPAEEEIQALSEKAKLKLHDFSDVNEDLEDTLAMLDCIDDYISVSNTNVHIRASLDKACRVLIPFPGDWRWGHNSSRSYWFPKTTVYRQESDLSWDKAVDELASQLHNSL